MVDPKAFREGVGRLLGEVQRIKSEGDLAGAKKLFDSYGIHFDPKVRDEMVARVDKLNLPSYTGLRDAEADAGHRRRRQDYRRGDLPTRWISPHRCSSYDGVRAVNGRGCEGCDRCRSAKGVERGPSGSI